MSTCGNDGLPRTQPRQDLHPIPLGHTQVHRHRTHRLRGRIKDPNSRLLAFVLHGRQGHFQLLRLICSR